MPQTESTKAIRRHERVALYRQRHAAANRWAAGYGPIQHTVETQDRVFAMAELLAARGSTSISQATKLESSTTGSSSGGVLASIGVMARATGGMARARLRSRS